MSVEKVIRWLAIAAAITAAGFAQALAQETLKFGACFDLSKSYTFISPQVAQAAQDLAALTNMKGGIDGH
ncbi:hypothetical protein ACI394_28610, partial [Klebsiella pneumoniae]|uniref:hypothetical protein n=1 Tax=Klebsiella pneumoniae TaxID=573 RepID=UPI003853BA8A